MAEDPWQLTGSGPESYERYQVPSVFGPLARLLLQHVPPHPGQRMLDVACGTGIVARLAAPMLGLEGSVLGVDLNAGMLDIARRESLSGGALLEWRQADVAALPCQDAEFDMVLCQQGLQFFPDKRTALREMRRVLRQGGRIALCVWCDIEHSPCHVAIAEALRRHAGSEVARRFRAPFAFGDGDALHRALVEAGFQDAEVRVEVLERHLLPPEESIPGLLASTPVGPEVAALSGAVRHAIVEEVAAALSSYRDECGFTVPQPTHIALATR
jgi:ubiquinone/menaquinone biosynthesis C-methylase UbiE